MRLASGELMIPVPGGRLHAVVEGAGPAAVLLHASIVDSRAWEPLVPRLVAAGHRVVRYDARGCGRSETDDVAFSNRADVVAVLDALGIRRACLVGNSRGGQVAIDTAIEWPDRVAAVVALGANIGGFEPEPTPAEAAAFEEMDRLEEGDDIDAAVEANLRVWVDGLGQRPDRVPASVREAIREMAREALDPGRVRGRPIRLDPPAALRLTRLTTPVLAVAGALDVSDVWATAQHLERVCRDGRAVLVPGVAHMIGLEAPDLVTRLVVDLVRPLGGYP